MLSFFRRLINSRVGVVVTLVAIALTVVLFALGDINGLTSGLGGAGGSDGGAVARVGNVTISAAELKQRVQGDVENFAAQQPGLTIKQYIEGGGFDGTVNRLIDGQVIEQFAARHGMKVSKDTVDGQIAAIPALRGIDGKFDQKAYEQILAQRRMTDADVRRDIARSTLIEQLTIPTSGASQVPQRLALPYAALLLERRQGQVAFIPTRAMGAGTQPTAAELKTFYERNRARYTIPERRVVRYALVSPETVKAAATPTEAEIAAAYRQQAAKFAATEKRTISQVVLADKAAADTFAAKVKGGTAIDVAAKAIGLSAAKLAGVERKAYGDAAGPELAGQVFAAARGDTVGPVKAPLGWTVAHVDSIEKVTARTLDQARAELSAALTTAKTNQVLGDMAARIDDAIAKKTDFADLVAANKLQAIATPPLLADGRDPASEKSTPDPALAPILKAAFAADPEDDPQIVATGAQGSFAVVKLDRVVPAAAPPLAELAPVIARDFTIDRARKAARAIAADVVRKVSAGTPLAEALKATKLTLPPIERAAASRAQLQAAQQGAPPPLTLMFTMAPRTAKLLEAPNSAGWLIVYLDTIERADPSGRPQVVQAQQADLGRMIGSEYIRQFIEAMRREIGVKRHEDVIAKVRRDLLGLSGEAP